MARDEEAPIKVEPKTRGDAPDSGEIEWARGFIPNPPAPGEAEASPDTGKPDYRLSDDQA